MMFEEAKVETWYNGYGDGELGLWKKKMDVVVDTYDNINGGRDMRR